jgi:hypothetical protein
LSGAKVVICPDRDAAGLNYAEDIAKDFPDAQWLYVDSTSPQWKSPKDGFDIGDWLDSGVTVQVVLAAIGERRQRTTPTVSETDLPKAIREAISQGLSGAELEAQKLTLSQQTRTPVSAIKTLWESVEKEIDAAERAPETAAALDNILNNVNQRLDLNAVLPGDLAGLIERIAALLASTPEVIFSGLLSATASCAKIGTQLDLRPASGWIGKPIIWVGGVGGPGTSKTPSFDISFNPLRAMQYKESCDFKEKMTGWKLREATAKRNKGEEFNEEPPVKPRLFLDDFTLEALARIQIRQPDRGCLIGIDELAGLIDGANQYKGGRGDDRSKLISARGGKGLNLERASTKPEDNTDSLASSFSIAGGIQPKVLQRQMGDFDDPDGLWSRFFWCFIPLKRRVNPTPEDAQCNQKLTSIISRIFRGVRQFDPKLFLLTESALAQYDAFVDEQDELKMQHPNGAMKVVHSKTQGQVGDIALVLHLLNAAYHFQEQPDPFVSEATMIAAIKVMRFYISQAELIQNLGAEKRGEEPAILAKILDLSTRKGWISARDCKQTLNALKATPPDEVRTQFVALAAQGKGETRGDKKAIEFRAFTSPVEAEAHRGEPKTRYKWKPSPATNVGRKDDPKAFGTVLSLIDDNNANVYWIGAEDSVTESFDALRPWEGAA